MIDDSTYRRLRELIWRRKLTEGEEAELRAWLAAHPEAQLDWDAEASLNDALGLLPEAVVPSNFTARVLRAVKLDEAAELRRGRRLQVTWWRRLVTKIAFAAVLLVVGVFSYQQIQAARIRSEVAKGLVFVSKAELPPAPEDFEDFNVIRIMPQLYADEDLLALLQ